MGAVQKVEVRQSQRGGVAFYQHRQQSMLQKQRQQKHPSSPPGSPSKRKRFGSFSELTRRISRQPKESHNDHGDDEVGGRVNKNADPSNAGDNSNPKNNKNTATATDTNTATTTVEKRRKKQVFYALKSIILDRVSPIMMEELKNEVDRLKGMVRM